MHQSKASVGHQVHVKVLALEPFYVRRGPGSRQESQLENNLTRRRWPAFQAQVCCLSCQGCWPDFRDGASRTTTVKQASQAANRDPNRYHASEIVAQCFRFAGNSFSNFDPPPASQQSAQDGFPGDHPRPKMQVMPPDWGFGNDITQLGTQQSASNAAHRDGREMVRQLTSAPRP